MANQIELNIQAMQESVERNRRLLDVLARRHKAMTEYVENHRVTPQQSEEESDAFFTCVHQRPILEEQYSEVARVVVDLKFRLNLMQAVAPLAA